MTYSQSFGQLAVKSLERQRCGRPGYREIEKEKNDGSERKERDGRRRKGNREGRKKKGVRQRKERIWE